jgi:putative RecB family exonuclease
MLDTKALFESAWDEEVAKRQEQSPSFSPEEYTATGRAAAAYGGKRNADWWHDNGPGLVDNWIKWRTATQWPLWETPDGAPAIELGLTVHLPGDIPVKLFIDRVFVVPSGELAVVDLKTGRTPETEEQLGLYATALELQYGEQYRPRWGYFWDAHKGDHGKPLDLSRWTPEVFAEMYRQACAGINAGAFLPSPANNCKNWCGTARYCHAVGGPEAIGIDPIAPTQT